jgi:hypothetical protein
MELGWEVVFLCDYQIAVYRHKQHGSTPESAECAGKQGEAQEDQHEPQVDGLRDSP